MYASTRSNNLRRSIMLGADKPQVNQPIQPLDHQKRVRRELKQLGVSWFGMSTMESAYLPTIIHPDEHIGGVVYGRHPDGFAMMVATDRRILFIDRKPLFENEDEITYDVVSGVSYGHAGLGSTVTLHTRIKDYPIRSYNRKCAHGFVEYIEERCLEHSNSRRKRNA